MLATTPRRSFCIRTNAISDLHTNIRNLSNFVLSFCFWLLEIYVADSRTRIEKGYIQRAFEPTLSNFPNPCLFPRLLLTLMERRDDGRTHRR